MRLVSGLCRLVEIVERVGALSSGHATVPEDTDSFATLH
jgi:hypothetical protein